MRFAIHLIANSLDPTHGGLEQSALRIAGHLSRHPAGAQIFLYSRDQPSVAFPPDLLGRLECLARRRNPLLEPVAHVKNVHLKPRLDISLFRTAVRRKMKKHPNLTHCVVSFYASSAGFVAQHVSAALGIPHIVSVRGTDYAQDFYSVNRMHSFEFAVKNATFVVTTNLTQERSIREVCGRTERVRTIYNSLDIPGEMGFWTNTPGERVRVFADSGFSFKKATHFLLRAVEGLLNRGMPIHLTVVGATEDESADFFAVERRRLKEAFPDCVDFRDFVSLDEVSQSLRASHLYCTTSLSEGCSNALLRPLLYGMPIVSTNVGILPDVIDNLGHVFLSAPGDFDEYSDNLHQAVEKLRTGSVAVDHGAISVLRNRLSSRAEADAWHRVVDDACGDRGAGASSAQRRILFFVHDGLGLGHLRRVSRIAQALQGPCACLVVSGHRQGAWLVPPECEYFHLPSLDSLLPNKARYWRREPFLRLSRPEALHFRKHLLASVVSAFRPDALFVDYLPLGKHEELATQIYDGAFRKYFILRGVLDHPEHVRTDIFKGKGEEALAFKYDRVFVTCDEKICDVAAEYNIPQAILNKMTYAGYVSDPVSEMDIRSARLERGVPSDKKWIVCSAGGGVLGERLITECLRLCKLLRDHYFDIVLGPRSSLTWNYQTADFLADERIRIHRECQHLPILHAACDVAVIAGGYNSLVEAMEGHAAIVVVPSQLRDNDEQYIHTAQLSKFVPMQVVLNLHDLRPSIERAAANTAKRVAGESRSVLSFEGVDAIRNDVLRDLGVRG
jgi:predicted glycosyltransferase/glycosyltransferase involved in cell wall biosynthesis